EAVAAVPPPPQEKPKAKEKPEPKPKPKPEVKPKPQPMAPPQLVKAKPQRKPKPPDPFASVLKTVEKLDPQSRKPKEDEEKKQKKPVRKKEEEFDLSEIAKAIQAPEPRYNPMRPLSISEIDLVRQQIARCWNLPAGAKGAENMAVQISVVMNPDGRVQSATINNKLRMTADSFYRSMAESARRAVLNKNCQPFKLPPDRYDIWKTMTLNFDPREMF
ncbi:MAG: TonB C-terminal domain-containing protein, partial [Rhodospirillales bacterium]|nr:TonB C-terminal domain-containing protein [Rhodospirillales bacterium]